ncbi:hypothetical protein CEXT_29761 [Caerostris extrusa]|uniref:Uncharacterized protein n=1 Tax=Caerostris extrusa TaxID=172846 RepID=A0AAV4U5W5_CAEEX|nr:hypothetical protein CEXT_29761 [Caerostris extrusa]
MGVVENTISEIQLLEELPSGTLLDSSLMTPGFNRKPFVCESLHFTLSQTILINRRDVVWPFCAFRGVEGCLECVSVLTLHDEVVPMWVEDKGTRKIVWPCVVFCSVGAWFKGRRCLFRHCVHLS